MGKIVVASGSQAPSSENRDLAKKLLAQTDRRTMTQIFSTKPRVLSQFYGTNSFYGTIPLETRSKQLINNIKKMATLVRSQYRPPCSSSNRLRDSAWRSALQIHRIGETSA